jgi:hypothetical protein
MRYLEGQCVHFLSHCGGGIEIDVVLITSGNWVGYRGLATEVIYNTGVDSSPNRAASPDCEVTLAPLLPAYSGYSFYCSIDDLTGS